MKLLKLTAAVVFAMSLQSCGSSDDGDDDKADVVTHCAATNADSGAGLDMCMEATNADPTDFKSSCTNTLKGTYADGACTVTAGRKGCRSTNANGVLITTWYTGTAWTEADVADSCKDEGDTVVTK